MTSRAPVPIICYDMPVVSDFFRSVALAVAIEEETGSHFVPFKGDTNVADWEAAIVGTVFMAIWDELPGTWHTTLGDANVINRSANYLHEQYLNQWLGVIAAKGPVAGNRLVEAAFEMRERARHRVELKFADVSSANAAMRDRAMTALRTLARIRLAANIGVAVLSGGIGIAAVGAGAAGGASGLVLMGAQAGFVDFAYSATGAMIQDWHKGEAAKIAAVSYESSKYVGEEALGQLLEKVRDIAFMRNGGAAGVYAGAKNLARKLSIQAGKQGLAKSAKRKLGQKAGQAGIANKAAKDGFASTSKNAARAQTALAGVSVVFAAWDVYEALDEYGDTMSGRDD